MTGIYLEWLRIKEIIPSLWATVYIVYLYWKDYHSIKNVKQTNKHTYRQTNKQLLIIEWYSILYYISIQNNNNNNNNNNEINEWDLWCKEKSAKACLLEKKT